MASAIATGGAGEPDEELSSGTPSATACGGSNSSDGSEDAAEEEAVRLRAELNKSREEATDGQMLPGAAVEFEPPARPLILTTRRSALDRIVRAAKIAASEEGGGAQEFLCTDADDGVRGACRGCGLCKRWSRKERREVNWWRAAGPLCGSPRNRVPPEEAPRCGVCNCTAEEHEDLTNWVVDIRDGMRRFRATGVNTSRPLPELSRMPAEALRWEVSEAALYALTLGRFDPRNDRRAPNISSFSPGKRRDDGDGALVSVCVPTTQKRRCFEILIYKNFIAQTYEPKELVVIDTGKEPSEYMKARARSDSRVIYRFFGVEDAKEESQERTTQVRRGPRDATSWAPLLVTQGGEPTARNPPRSWSLGMKRNIACHLAKGAIIAHFDDDDIYASAYLENMVAHLELAMNRAKRTRTGVGAGTEGGLPPAIATLSQWHMVDLADMTFRFMDPKRDPDVQKDWVEPMMYGYGFSYVYTKAAWELQAFPDVEKSEDDIFMKGLREKGAIVELVELPGAGDMTPGQSDRGAAAEAWVAHSFHRDCTSRGEFSGMKRLGAVVSKPKAFEDLAKVAAYAFKDSAWAEQLPSTIAGAPEWAFTSNALWKHRSAPMAMSTAVAASNGGRAQGHSINGKGFGSVWTDHDMPAQVPRKAKTWKRQY